VVPPSSVSHLFFNEIEEPIRHYLDLSFSFEDLQRLLELQTTMSNFSFSPVPPLYDEYAGQSSFFGGTPPLSSAVGYVVVLGFGFFFSIVTTILVFLDKYFVAKGDITSEHFK
jgi:hypothetical protein